jgi:putative spermidine/putrescine transport system ATP-binding protein
MVFQNYALFPHMTVAENVSFPLRMRGASRGEIEAGVRRVLAMVRLGGLEDRRPAQLSGGQQQRVALARAAVYDPLLLLMDEPLGALDKNLREEMQEEIKRFQAALGATVLYVTHDQQEAAFMADRIAVMRAGRVEQTGSPRELYERPANLFVAGFLGEASILSVAEVAATDGGEPAVRTDGGLTVRATAAGPVRPGSAVCVRPEGVLLGPEARGADNVFQGVVEEAVYTAGSIRYRVRVGEGRAVVTVRRPSRPGTRLLSPGTQVEVGWSRRDALVVPEG